MGFRIAHFENELYKSDASRLAWRDGEVNDRQSIAICRALEANIFASQG